MTEVLFCLSVGFVAYIAYVLVDEQRANQPALPFAKTRPPKAIAPKRTVAKKAKPATAKKPTATAKSKPATLATNKTPDAIISYLSKNGQTSIAKLSKDLPGGRKAIEDKLNRLIEAGAISQTTIGRAKAVAIKS